MPELHSAASRLFDVLPGELVLVVGHGDEPLPLPGDFTFSDLAEQLFTVMDVSASGVCVSAPRVDGPDPLVVLVPPHVVPMLQRVSVWPLLAADFPDLFRIVPAFHPVTPRRGAPSHRLEVKKALGGGRFMFAADLGPGAGSADPELLIEGAVRAALKRMDWLWTLKEPHDGPVEAMVRISVAVGECEFGTREVQGEGESAALALCRALVLAMALDRDMDAAWKARTGADA